MSVQRERDPYWVDELWEKHECGGYSDVAYLQVTIGDKNLRVIVPQYRAEVEVLHVTRDDPYLFLLGRATGEHANNAGIVIVAKHVSGNHYAAVVWHGLYWWALKYLGLKKG
jgi:hypothetical protein